MNYKHYCLGAWIGVMAAGGMIGLFRLGREVLQSSANSYVVVIDSGHGGVDPGKVGVNEVYEKDVNLSISLALEEELKKAGCRVVMTRREDVGLYQETDTNKKVADLKKRVELMNGASADIVISIHQNSFRDASSKGAQVFYYTSSEMGKNLAEILQNTLKEKVDSSNKRTAKANADYYILKNSHSPAVIVECGFLSNPEEAGKLCSEEYQKKLVEAITEGVERYRTVSSQQVSTAPD